ncbi:hypothetical protein CyaNS01_01158 [Cyanobium sp. NS01]|nr:hypothetical protein CyaNS01_01158 [Cyanobium sp. NS01]
MVINLIVCGEIAFACERIEGLDEILPARVYDYRAIPSGERKGGDPGIHQLSIFWPKRRPWRCQPPRRRNRPT